MNSWFNVVSLILVLRLYFNTGTEKHSYFILKIITAKWNITLNQWFVDRINTDLTAETNNRGDIGFFFRHFFCFFTDIYLPQAECQLCGLS